MEDFEDEEEDLEQPRVATITATGARWEAALGSDEFLASLRSGPAA